MRLPTLLWWQQLAFREATNTQDLKSRRATHNHQHRGKLTCLSLGPSTPWFEGSALHAYKVTLWEDSPKALFWGVLVLSGKSQETHRGCTLHRKGLSFVISELPALYSRTSVQTTCYRLKSHPPKNSYVEALTVFGHRTFKEVNSQVKSWGWGPNPVGLVSFLIRRGETSQVFLDLNRLLFSIFGTRSHFK